MIARLQRLRLLGGIVKFIWLSLFYFVFFEVKGVSKANSDCIFGGALAIN